VKFLSGFDIDPPLVPAKHRIHEHDLVLRNPWKMGISGTIRLLDTAGCTMSPRQRSFVIAPQSEVRLPLDIIVERTVSAGTKRIEAEVLLEANNRYRLRMHTDIEIGWRNISLHATWSVAENAENGQRDLIVTLYVKNSGTEALTLDTSLRAPNVRQRRRPIGHLLPGMTAVKRFRIEQGPALLAGRTVRLIVADPDGVAQLSYTLWIPDFVGLASADTLPDETRR